MDPLLVLTVIFSGLFGLIIGSFLNVVILRRNTGRTILGRSGCLSCGAPLVSHDLVPVASFMLLRGHCRSCGSRISLQYPVVEGVTALVFGVIAASGIPLIPMMVAFVVAVSAVVITAYDIRHTIVPDSYVLIFAVASLALRFLQEPHAINLLISAVLGALVTAAPLLGLWLVSQGRWLGFGDVKLAAAIGVLVGPAGGITALWLAYVLGAALVLSYLGAISIVAKIRTVFSSLRLSRAGVGLTMKSEIAFGPFLILGCMIVWIATLYGTTFTLSALLW